MSDKKNLETVKKDGALSYSIALAKSGPSGYYLYVKTMKIVSAIYLVSDTIGHDEPARSRLRSLSLELMSHMSDAVLTRNIGRLGKGEPRSRAPELLFTLSGILEACRVAGILSESNTSILAEELSMLSEAYERAHQDASTSNDLSGEALAVEKAGTVQGLADKQAQGSIGQRTLHDKRQNSVRDMSFSSSSTGQFETGAAKEGRVPRAQGGNAVRSERVLALVRKKGRVGVKDVSLAIPEWSEKTAQRELVALVAKGVLKREGERRWSVYLLAS